MSSTEWVCNCTTEDLQVVIDWRRKFIQHIDAETSALVRTREHHMDVLQAAEAELRRRNGEGA